MTVPVPVTPCKYDVFISVSGDDVSTVGPAIEQLRADGIERIFFYIDRGIAGEPIPQLIDNAIESSRVAILFFSEKFLAAKYCMSEYSALVHRHNNNARGLWIIPVRLDNVEMPPLTASLRCVDYREQTQNQYQQLYDSCLAGLGRKTESAQTVVENFRPPKYIKHLQSESCKVSLIGLNADITEPSLEQVYISPVASSRHEKPKSASALELESAEHLVSLLNKHNLYLSGGPGSGKTTFCRRILSLLCDESPDVSDLHEDRRTLSENHRTRLPVFIQLGPFWQDIRAKGGGSFLTLEETLQSWIRRNQHWGLAWTQVDDHITRGVAMIIFDGLDELPSYHLPKGWEEVAPREWLISELRHQLPMWIERGNRVLITGRSRSMLPDEYRQLSLEPVYLDDLTPKAQKALVTKIFRTMRRSDGCARAMLYALQRNSKVASFGSTPLLLTAACIIWTESEEVFNDQSRLCDLLNRLVNCTLRKRFSDVKSEDMRRYLEKIAARMQSSKLFYTNPLISFETIEEIIRSEGCAPKYARKTRRQLVSQSGLLEPSMTPEDHVKFIHALIQTYLAARQFSQGDLVKFIDSRLENPEWRETLTFAFYNTLLQSEIPWTCFEALQKLHTGTNAASTARIILLGTWIKLFSDCVELVQKSNVSAPVSSLVSEFSSLKASFRELCVEAIQADTLLEDRIQIGHALGAVGDPRIQSDLRNNSAFVSVPARVFRSRDREISIDRPYLISKFPVTNLQYAKFVEADGYHSPAILEEFWSSGGRKWLNRRECEQERPHGPMYWHDPNKCGPNQPVVGISFWEAEAFCNWVGGHVMSADQWEAAATGPEGFIFPWGNDMPKEFRRSAPGERRHALPVALFPQTSSIAYGLEDMAGNVWQWCSDGVHGDRRTIRGGYFSGEEQWYQCRYRGDAEEDRQFSNIGIRVVKPLN